MIQLRSSPLVIVALCLSISTSTASDRCVAYDEVARLIGGQRDGTSCMQIARKEEVVYLPRGSALRLVDASDPVRPVTFAQIPLPDTVRLLRSSGEFLACATQTGTLLFDIRDPREPVLLWQDQVSGRRGLAFAPGLFYRRTETHLEAYSLEVGQAPEFISSIAVPTYSKLEVDGGLAYLAQPYNVVQCYDVSDPAQMTLRGSFNATGNITGFVARAQRLYITKYNNNISGGYLLAVDASDPDQLVLRSTIPMYCGWLSRITLDGNLAIVTSGDDLYNAGFVVVDVSDPDQPVWVGRCDTVYGPYGLAIAHSREVTVGFDTGFGVFDLNDLAFIHESDFEWSGPDVWAIERRGNYLWVGTADGMAIWDATNPLHVVPVTSADWNSGVRSLHDDGTVLFAGTTLDLLFTVSTASPTNPTRTGSYATAGGQRGAGHH